MEKEQKIKEKELKASHMPAKMSKEEQRLFTYSWHGLLWRPRARALPDIWDGLPHSLAKRYDFVTECHAREKNGGLEGSISNIVLRQFATAGQNMPHYQDYTESGRNR